MINPRALVRAAVKDALADEDTGFNANFAAIADGYGITAFVIDWSPGSPTFVQSFFDPGTVAISRFLREPVGLALYTSAATDSEGERSKTSQFDGLVLAHIDAFLRFDEGIETSDEDTEAFADAIEDAVLQAIHGPALAGVNFNDAVQYHFEYSCVRDPIIGTEAGYEQRIPMTFLFSVIL